MTNRKGAGDPTAVEPSSGPLVRRWRSTVQGARGLRNVADMRLDPTYRRLAAGYRLPDGSRRVYLHHIRKTAGTSVFLSFLALGGEDPTAVWHRINAARLSRTVSGGYAFVSIHRKLLAEGDFFFGRAHRPVEDQPLAEGTFTVTVLRDPVSRVHSYFDYLVEGDSPDSPGRVAERERWIALDGFDVFLDRVPQRHLLSQLHTFSSALDVSVAAERVAACSAVFFTERYAEGLAALSDRLEVPLAVHRARVTGRRSMLTPAQADRLREVLEPEYQLLARLDDAGVGGRNRPT
jgi:hypothetical protein